MSKSWIPVAVLLLGSVAPCQRFRWTGESAFLPENAPRTILPIDLDGDGDLDLLTGETLWTNTGSAQYRRRGPAPWAGPSSAPAHVFDADGDGDDDVVAIEHVGSVRYARIYRNDGTGSFAADPPLSAAASVVTVRSADLDGDGDLDLIAAPSLMRNDGPAGFTDVTAQALPWSLWSFSDAVVADFDGDGRPDLALRRYTVPNTALVLNTGGLAFAPASANVPNNTLQWPTDSGDADGDGDVDLLTAGPRVEVWTNDGTARFTALPVPRSLAFPTFVDLDGNGRLEILGQDGSGLVLLQRFGSFYTDVTSRFIGDPAGTYYGRFAADLDGNGRLDLLLLEGYTFRILLQDSRFRLVDVHRRLVTGGRHLADLDGNGLADEVEVANAFTAPVLQVRWSEPGRVLDTATTLRVFPSTTSSVDEPRFAFADFDADGDLDVVATQESPIQPAGLWRNDGNRAFVDVTANAMPRLPVAPTGLATGDVDGDGIDDLFLTDRGGSRLFVSTGTGYVDGTSTWLPPNPLLMVSPELADLDGDGRPELLGSVGLLTQIWSNTGSSFVNASATWLPPGQAGMGCVSHRTLDFDGDGLTDLARVLAFGVILLRNNGAGALILAPASLQPPSSPSPLLSTPIVVEDFDEDGDPDMLFSAHLRAAILLRNDGAAGWTDASAEIGRPELLAASFADVDGDGDRDLVGAGAVLRSFRRQILGPAIAMVGSGYEIAVHGGNGGAWATALGLAGGLAASPLRFPGVLTGTFWLDPATTTFWPVQFLPSGTDRAAFRFAVPARASQIGLEFATQALLLEGAALATTGAQRTMVH